MKALFQLNRTLATELDGQYRTAGLDMAAYGYNVRTHQAIGAHRNIPRNDLEKILEIQLEFVYNCRPTGVDWVTSLKNATRIGEAAEIFLVRFLGAISSNNNRAGDRLLYISAGQRTHFQEADRRREFAAEYYDLFAR